MVRHHLITSQWCELLTNAREPPLMSMVLATYKICHIKWWLNHFLSLQETSFIAKLLSLEVLWRWLIFWLILTVVSLSKCWKSAIFIKKRLLQKSHCFPSFHWKLTSFLSLFSHQIPVFSLFSLLPFIKIPFIRFENPFWALSKPSNSFENHWKSMKIHVFYYRL